MDENYYKELIDKVQIAQSQYQEILYNENDMRDPIGDGFDYFTKLWNIINDKDLNVSDETYFTAVSLCLGTFYGERQDSLPIWQNIIDRYKSIIQKRENLDEYNDAFLRFLNNADRSIPTMELFYELMHLAIDSKNLEAACKLLWMTPTEVESWGQIQDVYENDPEWAAYLECLSDISYDKLPNDPDFKATVRNLYLSFGDNPEMEKMRALYNRYF